MKMMCRAKIWVGALAALMVGFKAQALNYWFDNNGTAPDFGFADGGSYNWMATTAWNTDAAGGSGTLATWPGGSNQAYLIGAGANTTYTVRFGTDGATGVTLQNFGININATTDGASGSGNVIIGNSNDSGVLTLNAANSVGAQAGGLLVINNPVNLNAKTFNFRGGSVVVNGLVSGTSTSKILFGGGFGLTSGTLTLANTANTYAGRLNTDYLTANYTLVVTKVANGGTASSLGTSSANIGFNGGTLKFIGTGSQNSNLGFHIASNGAKIEAGGDTQSDTVSFSGAPTYSGSDAIARSITVTGVNGGNNTLSFNYGINTGGGVNSFTKSGAGRWVLTGVNTFTGPVTISGGVLAINNSDALGTHATTKMVTITASANKWLELDSSISGGSNITLSDKIAFTTSGISGAIRNVAGNNRINGKITMALGNGNTKIISDGGTLTLAGGVTANTGGRILDLAGSSTEDNTLTGGFDNGNTPSLNKTGTGTWILSGANTFAGVTTIAGGTLKIAHNLALQSSPLDTVLTGGGTLDLTGVTTPTIGGLTNSGALVLPANVTALTLNPSGTVTYFGSISGGASGLALTKTGAGSQALHAANNYDGLTTVSAGALLIAHNNALGATAEGVVITANAALALADGIVVTGESLSYAGYGTNVRGALQTAANSTAEWAGPLLIGAGDSRVGAQAGGTLTISGKISDGAGSALVVSADQMTGKVIVSGDSNDYTGESVIIRGTLQLGRDNSLPVGSVLNVHAASSVSDAAFFEMDGFSQTVAGIKRGNTSGPATIKNSSGMLSTLTVTNTSSYTFDSLIAGRLALIKRGLGTLTLSGANTYSNGTTIAEGTLVLSVGNAGGTGDLMVANGATCTVTSVSSALADTATVSLGASAVMNLGEGVNETVRCLYINGVQQGSGVWNAARDPVRFSGSGSLVVLVGGGTRVSFF